MSDITAIFDKLAVFYFDKACSLKNLNSCFSAGQIYFLGGKGVKKAEKIANDYFSKACDLNNANGCLYLGNNYKTGTGFRVDHRQSAYFYSKACDLKSDLGCYNLAKAYRDGQGIKEDRKKAYDMFQSLCDKGMGKSCNRVGKMIEFGLIEVNDLRYLDFAAQAYAKGCDLGSKRSCDSLERLKNNISLK